MKKILFAIIVLFGGLLTAYLGYSHFQYKHVNGLVSEAIEEENYSELSRIFGGFSDTKAVKLETAERLTFAVYTGTSQTNVPYGKDERFNKYEETYYIYLLNVNFIYTAYNDKNATSFVFEGEKGEFNYPFVINDKINKNLLNTEITNEKELLFNSARDILVHFENWDYFHFNLTKTMVDYISEDIGKIKGIKITDNQGDLVSRFDVNFDFQEDFFKDVEPLILEYNKALNSTNSKDALDKFDKFYEPWFKQFKKNMTTTGYTYPYDRDYLIPSKVGYQTLGALSIFMVVMFVLYFLTFRLEKVKQKIADRKIRKIRDEIRKEKEELSKNGNNNEKNK